jgi:SAM-dependent methyltransferase
MQGIVDFMELFPPLSTFQTVLLIIILIPTLIALITGAPWVPTPQDRVEKMLELGKIKKGEKVFDLGCGDGRLVHLASIKYGANATGLEFSPLIFALATSLQPWYWFKGSQARIRFKNFYRVNLKEADVIVTYLLPHAMRRVQKKCEKELKKGARVISYAFPITDWTPIHRQKRNRKKQYGPIWVYEMGKHR